MLLIKYKDYYASIRFSSEDEVFHGKFLKINDLVTFEGSSAKELKKAFREAVEDYLQTCMEIDKEPNEAKQF